MSDRAANSTIGRNIAIIVVLLVAISVTWKLLQNKKAANTALAEEAKRSEKVAAEKRADDLEKIRSEAKEKVAQRTRPAPTSPEPAAPSETPAQSLIRLRENLADGDFDELPIGTLTLGDSYFFLVSKAMTWPEASRMARTYGGHLPIVNDPGLVTSLKQAATKLSQDTTWIGAARTSPQQWQWVSAAPWSGTNRPQGSGPYAALRTDEQIIAATSSAHYPFFIQWQRDGSNPTALAGILESCRASLGTAEPVYPPGTETVGDRKVMIVEEPTTYSEAAKLAELGGGRLMTLGTAEEADWLETRSASLQASEGLWLGATREETLWGWVTETQWTFGRWAANAEPGSGTALLHQPKAGWVPMDPGHLASGFVIEWGDEPASESPESPDQSIADLEHKAKEILGAHQKARGKAASKNADDYIFKLEVWLRKRGNNAQVAEWTPHVKKVISTVQNGRLPDDIPDKPDGTYAKPLLDIAQFHLTKQNTIDSGFFAKAGAMRDAYVSRHQEAATKARELGQIDLAAQLEAQVTQAEDLQAWLGELGFPEP